MDTPFFVTLDHQHQTLISIKDPGHSLCKILCKAGNAFQSVLKNMVHAGMASLENKNNRIKGGRGS